MQIKYVKMPITFEKKRALNKQGYRVIDAKFDPSPQVVEEEKPKRKTRVFKK